jgi:hypothetical protein
MTDSRSSLKIGSFAWGRAQIAAHAALSREDIARLLECNSLEPWPDELLKPVINALRGERRRGRKQIVGTARWDFLIHDAFELYQAKRAEFTAEPRTTSTKADRISPSDRALAYVLEAMRDELGNIGPGRLRNVFSVFQFVHDWEPPDCPVEHEELEAAWESQQSERNFRECAERPDGVQTDTKPEEDAE